MFDRTTHGANTIGEDKLAKAKSESLHVGYHVVARLAALHPARLRERAHARVGELLGRLRWVKPRWVTVVEATLLRIGKDRESPVELGELGGCLGRKSWVAVWMVARGDGAVGCADGVGGGGGRHA